jgi:hypothetical protein
MARGSSLPMTDPSTTIVRCAQPGTPSSGCPSAAGACTTVARGVAARATVAPSRCPARGRPFPARGSGPVPGPGRADLTRRAESRVDACGPGRKASPPCSPATGSAAARCGGWAAPPVTARDPAPGPASLPLRPGRAARRPPPGRNGEACRPHGLLPGLAGLLIPAGRRLLAGGPSGWAGAGGGRT